MNPQVSTADLRTDVLAASAGDVSAYGRLVDRHRSLVTSIALAEVKDRGASEDVAQEVFLHAWAGLKKLRNPDSFLPWLREITRNRARRVLRGRSRQHLDPEASLEAISDAAPGAPEQLVKAEEHRILGEALERLPDDAREALTLFHREGCSTQQVAQLLGLSDEAVRKRLSRARAALKEDVERSFGIAARDSSPGPAFTAAVLAALPTGPTAATTGTWGAPWSKLLAASGLAAVALVAFVVPRDAPRTTPPPSRPGGTTSPAPLAEAPTRALLPPSTPTLAAPAVSDAASNPNAARIEGEVEALDGKPAVGAQVAAIGDATLHATTDTGGRFSLELPAGSYRLVAWKGSSAGTALEPVQLAERGLKRGVVIHLGAPTRVEGTVVSAVGAVPVPGATVAFAGSDGAVLASAVSDSKGAFTFTGVPSELDLVVTAPGFAAQVRPRLHFEPGQPAPLRVELDRESIAEGVVRDGEGQPVAGAEVVLGNPINGGRRAGDAQPKATSNADGTFRFAGLVRGGARLGAVVGEANAPNVLIQLEPGKTTHVELKLFENGHVHGTVRSADGKPIRGKVMVRAAPLKMSDETGLVPRYDYLEADGTYDLKLLPGDYRIGAFVDGARQDFKRSSPISVESGKTLVQDLTLPEAVEGQVVDPSGAPVANARIWLRAPRFEGANACFWFDGRSDSEGHFRFPRPLCASTFVARAMAGGGVVESGDLASGVSDLRLQLQRPGRVVGTVHGLGVRGFRVRLDQTPWVVSDHQWLEFTGDRFTLDDVPAGKLELVIETTDGLTGRAAVTLAPGGAADVTVEVAAPK